MHLCINVCKPGTVTKCVMTIGMRFCTRFIEDNIIKWEAREASCNHDSGVTVHVEGENDDNDLEQANKYLEQGIVIQYLHTHVLISWL